MSRLNNDKRNQAIGMLQAGADVDHLLAHLVFTGPLTQDKFINTGSVEDRPRPGQPKKSTAQDDCSITLRVLRNCNIIALMLEVVILGIE